MDLNVYSYFNPLSFSDTNLSRMVGRARQRVLTSPCPYTEERNETSKFLILIKIIKIFYIAYLGYPVCHAYLYIQGVSNLNV